MKALVFKMSTLAFLLGGLASHQGHALEVGDEAPCVVLDQVLPDGTETTGCISEVVDERHDYTLVEFFSVFCGACERNLPVLSALAQDISDVATTRIVSLDRQRADVDAYIEEKASIIKFPVALDPGRDSRAPYGIRFTPTLYVLDRDSTVVYKHIGTLSDSDVQAITDLIRN